jgi:hypothetical protein
MLHEEMDGIPSLHSLDCLLGPAGWSVRRFLENDRNSQFGISVNIFYAGPRRIG